MTSSELLVFFRSDMGDTVPPYLWSDPEVYAYMNDAYFMFVRLIGGIPDYQSDVCTLTTTANEPFSALDSSILNIRMATLKPNSDPVTVINAQDVSNSYGEDDYYQLRTGNQWTATGKVRYLVVGMEQDFVRWVRIPDAAYDVQLMVERLPLVPIDGPAQVFTDVKAHHHIHFQKWMRHLAYAKSDVETFSDKHSEDEATKFLAYCAKAAQEKEKYKHKVRVVRYGGL